MLHIIKVSNICLALYFALFLHSTMSHSRQNPSFYGIMIRKYFNGFLIERNWISFSLLSFSDIGLSPVRNDIYVINIHFNEEKQLKIKMKSKDTYATQGQLFFITTFLVIKYNANEIIHF